MLLVLLHWKLHIWSQFISYDSLVRLWWVSVRIFHLRLSQLEFSCRHIGCQVISGATKLFWANIRGVGSDLKNWILCGVTGFAPGSGCDDAFFNLMRQVVMYTESFTWAEIICSLTAQLSYMWCKFQLMVGKVTVCSLISEVWSMWSSGGWVRVRVQVCIP